MGQITMYLDDLTEQLLRLAAKTSGISQSRLASSLLQQRLKAQWPEWGASLVGAWQDFPLAESSRHQRRSHVANTSPHGSKSTPPEIFSTTRNTLLHHCNITLNKLHEMWRRVCPTY
jgi:hypothetical protein